MAVSTASTKAGAGDREKEFDLTDGQFRFLSELAYKETGIVLADGKRDMVYGRLVRRLRALKLDSFTQYCQLVAGPKGADEIGHLINAITTNLTGFFREGHHFEHLLELMQAAVQNPGARIRLWSAACSSGMEPYSMAMTAHRALAGQKNIDLRILATDIDTGMVETGRQGIYRMGDVEKVPASYSKYIESQPNDRVRVREDIRQMIAFKSLNLLQDWPMRGPFDVIFCRNVVIYFDKPTKVKLFDRMADMLVPDGFLYIGHSENLHGITDRFRLVGRTIYQRIS